MKDCLPKVLNRIPLEVVSDFVNRAIFSIYYALLHHLSDEGRPTGVSIHVSFGRGEMSELNQLSGGQKSVVALSFMFALQKCDPSPIYIFDEIDAHLDEDARRYIARWLSGSKNEEKSPQFITTTFRRELVDASDKTIGLQMVNNASRVKNMTKEDALKFVVTQNE